MLRRTYALASISFGLSMLAATGAAATAQRTFVASTGSPANTAFNCSITKPCRAFSEALGVTTSGGEVIVLDSAGYGPVTITKSVSIIAPEGVYAAVTVFSGDGIVISGGSIEVVLRGLTINGQGGNRGIFYTLGSRLTVERCVVRNMATFGIGLGFTGNIMIEDSVIRDNGSNGINITGNPHVVVARTTIEGMAGAKPVCKKGGVRLGMTADEVKCSGWGKPESVNRTTTRHGVHEQWVYGGRNYLYFEDGVLTSIQN